MVVHADVVRGAGTALLGVLLLASGPSGGIGQAAAGDDARLLLPGLIIEEGDLPIDADGRASLDGFPGARARRPLDAAVERRLEALRAERDRIGARNAAGAVPELLPPFPGDTAAPPRLDSGHPDPERLDAAPAGQ